MCPKNEISFMNKDIFIAKTPKCLPSKKIRLRNSNRLEKLDEFDFFDFESSLDKPLNAMKILKQK
jgi:hypothetical protein